MLDPEQVTIPAALEALRAAGAEITLEELEEELAAAELLEETISLVDLAAYWIQKIEA